MVESTHVQLILVDDNPAFLAGLGTLLAEDERIRVVGTALNAMDGIELVRRLQPDLVILDISMPGMNGLEAARLIKSQAGAPRVVILTLNNFPEYRDHAARVGADGFLEKTAASTDLLPLLRKLLPALLPEG